MSNSTSNKNLGEQNRRMGEEGRSRIRIRIRKKVKKKKKQRHEENQDKKRIDNNVALSLEF